MEREQGLITEKLCVAMKNAHCDAMVLTTPEAIYYSTGFAGSFLYKMHQPGLSLAVLLSSGMIYLIVSEFESQEAKRCCQNNVEILTYPTFIFVDDYADSSKSKKEQNNPLETFIMAIEILERNMKIRNVGLELDSLSYNARMLFEQYRRQFVYQNADYIIREAKTLKTPWEIEILRRTAVIDEIAMNHVGRELEAGMTHAAIQNKYKRYCFEQDDEIIEVNQFHTFGEKFSPTYIFSTEQVGEGDIVRLDGGPTIKGYYSDIARNYVVDGKMTDTQKRIYSALWKGYQAGLESIRPGMKMSDVFQKILKTVIESGIPNYSRGHHGHAIGCGNSAEDYPFISANQYRVFEPGMVMCMEVPYYSSKNHSFNIEDTFVVTDSGIELFTHTEPII